jgi:hypothetical protein
MPLLKCDGAVRSSSPTAASAPTMMQPLGHQWSIVILQLEKEQQWLELADCLIKHFAIRRRLLADSMPA